MIDIIKNFPKPAMERKVETAIRYQFDRLFLFNQSGLMNQGEVRLWILDFLKAGLGYADHEIETEVKVKGRIIDIVLKKQDQIFLVIECKSAKAQLSDSVIHQASVYAISVGASWAVVTNGQRWKLFHVAPIKGGEPVLTQLFDAEPIDENGLSDDDVFCLSLLQKKSLENGAAYDIYHIHNALSFENVHAEIAHPDVVKALCKRLEARYRNKMGVVVNIDPKNFSNVIDDAFGVVNRSGNLLPVKNS